MSNLRLLAQSLGLSITTVSRALDGYSDVAPATRERVQAAAQAMNYRPNPAARSLRRRRAEAVAVTLPTEPGRFGPPIFLDMLAACGAAACGGRPRPDAAADRRPRGRDGDLPAASGWPARRCGDRRAHAARGRARRLPEGTRHPLRHPRPHRPTGASMPSSTATARPAFARRRNSSQRLGHRRIAHIAAPQDLTFAHLRRQGWLQSSSKKPAARSRSNTRRSRRRRAAMRPRNGCCSRARRPPHCYAPPTAWRSAP